jgi:hypothetical protein
MTNTQNTHADAVDSSIALTHTVKVATYFIAACARSTRATGQLGINNAITKPLANLGGTPC